MSVSASGFDPFRILVAQVTNDLPLRDGGFSLEALSAPPCTQYKRAVHAFMSQEDDQWNARVPQKIKGTSPMNGANGSALPSLGHQKSPSGRPSREITLAEKSLISKMHGYMPAPQLLGILNERLRFDLGVDAVPYTLDQLKAEIDANAVTIEDGPDDWVGLRKLLTKARRSGVLEEITEQVINDFAVVYSLNAKQVMHLKDVLLTKDED